MEFLTPPPIRWLDPDGAPDAPAGASGPAEAPAGHGAPGQNGNGRVASFVSAPRRRAPASQFAIDRMELRDVTISYGQKPAVTSVSLPVRQGEVLALIGPSGCGKTTLLRSLNRLTELTRGAGMGGRITLDGVDISTIEPTLLRRRVTMVFQQPNPFPMSVFDNVAYVLREMGSRRPRKRALEGPVMDALERAGLLEEVRGDLDHPLRRPAATTVHRARARRPA
jgi:phosphate transport system ATP-binding protein